MKNRAYTQLALVISNSNQDHLQYRIGKEGEHI